MQIYDCLYNNYKVLHILACEQAPGKDRKNFGERKTEEFGGEAIGAGPTGSLSAGYVYFKLSTFSLQLINN